MANLVIPNTFVDGTLITASATNGNNNAIQSAFNTSVVQTDVPKTITATHQWNVSQSFNGGMQIAGATLTATLNYGTVFTLGYANDTVSPRLQSIASRTLFINELGNPVTIGGATTVTAGDCTVSAGRLVLGAAASKLVPGATSLSLRNTADAADNLLVTDAGAVTVRNGLTVNAGGAVVSGGATIGNGLTVSSGGATITGNSSVTGTLNVTGTITGATQASTLTGTTIAAGVTISSLTTVGILAAPHCTSPVVDSGGLTITAGGLTVSAGATALTANLTVGTTLAVTGAAGINGKVPVASTVAPTVAGTTYTSTEQNLLNDLRQRLINFGLYT